MMTDRDAKRRFKQWRSQDDLVAWAHYGHVITEAACASSRESAQSVKKNLGYIICSYRAVRARPALVALFNIVFKLDSGLFLAAAAAEGTQQSNKPQYDMLHPLFCHQVGRAPGTVGRACALPGPTLATPLGSRMIHLQLKVPLTVHASFTKHNY